MGCNPSNCPLLFLWKRPIAGLWRDEPSAATVTNALHGLGLQAQEQGNSALAEPPLLSYALRSANNPLSSLIISLILAWNRRHAAVLFAEWLQDLAVYDGSSISANSAVLLRSSTTSPQYSPMEASYYPR